VSCVDVAAEEAAAEAKKQPKAAFVVPKSKPKVTEASLSSDVDSRVAISAKIFGLAG